MIPMNDQHYIACDLGAESGRVVLGTLTAGKLQLEEIHRFPNAAVRIQDSLRWNVLGIFEELKHGLREVAKQQLPIAGLSVDSWAVDYVLITPNQPQVSIPYHYRDERTELVFQTIQNRIGRERIFAETGIQFLPFNTIYQLAAEADTNPQLLEVAETFLPIADYLNYLFSGNCCVESSMASTTQLYNPQTQAWSESLIDGIKLRPSLFPPIVHSGTTLGKLTAELCAETELNDVEVVATCSHDTGAAVAAVPADGDDWAYLSSGTWSLIGVELQAPLMSKEALEANFTNEVGLGGSIRFLKNIIGLWLLQQCRAVWNRQGIDCDYVELNRLAEQATPFRSLISPNDKRFLHPEDMTAAISEFCHETDQEAPETPGQFARCILESLALLYGRCLDTLEQLTGRTISKLHIVGGGCQSRLLNQLAANATGRTVLTGPVEATAIGNLLIQAIALGEVGSHEELRTIVRNSFPIETYLPQSSPEWRQAALQFSELEIST